jgi:MFS family permease
MDIGKSFTFVFEDEEWVSKLLIAAVISLITPFLLGIPYLLLGGYTVQLVRNVRRGEARPLPTWDNLGDKFREGLLLFIAVLVYSLPILIILCPFIIIAVATGDSQQAQDTLGILWACFACLAFLWGIAVALVTPALYVRLAETGELASLFRFGDIIGFTTRNIGSVIVAIVVAWVANLIASIVGTLLCGIGLLVTTPWAAFVAAHLYAQVALPPSAPPSTPEGPAAL